MSTDFQTGIFKGDDSFDTGKKAALKASEKLDGEPHFAVVFSSSEYNYDEAISGVRSVVGDAELMGCSTAGEFTEEDVKTGSVGVALISSDNYKFFTGIGKGLKEDVGKAIKNASSDFPEMLKDFPYKTVINLHDGLAGKGTQVTWKTLEILGQDVKLVGGSAGDDLKFNETKVFQDGKTETDAVALGMMASKEPITVAVEHGHEPISEPLDVTKSEDGMIYELNGRPAIEVLKEQAREDAMEEFGIDVDELEPGTDEWTKFMTNYEVGIEATQGYKIRWVGLTKSDEGPLKTACEVPEGSVVRITKGTKKDQIEASRKAARKAMEIAGDRDIAGALIFECAVRCAILGDDFPKAVEAMKDELDMPLLGFETYGEIAVERGQMSGFHNTTTVVMLIPK